MKKIILIIMMAVSMMACNKKVEEIDITDKIYRSMKAHAIQKEVFNEFKNDLDRWDFMGINGFEFYVKDGKPKQREILINHENIEVGERLFNHRIIAVYVDDKLTEIKYKK